MQKMQNIRGYMKKHTRMIRNKGYTVNEFCLMIGYSLRWYRTHCDSSDWQGHIITKFINEMENKND